MLTVLYGTFLVLHYMKNTINTIMKKMILSAVMLTGLAAFAQEQPKATEKETVTTTTQTPETPAVPLTPAKKETVEKETTATVQQPEATVREEKFSEQKKEPAKKSN